MAPTEYLKVQNIVIKSQWRFSELKVECSLLAKSFTHPELHFRDWNIWMKKEQEKKQEMKMAK